MFYDVCLVKIVILCFEVNVKIENVIKFCIVLLILFLNCIVN